MDFNCSEVNVFVPCFIFSKHQSVTYHSDPFEGKDGRPKEERVVFSPAHVWQIDGVCDVLQDRKREKKTNMNINSTFSSQTV